MAIKIAGTEVVSNARELKNIASIDSGTVTAFNSALNTDPTKGTLTKTFTQNETAEITLSANVSVGPVVSATKEVPQTGVSTKGNWDVNSTASNYDFHSTAANVTLTPTTAANSNVTTLTYSSVNESVSGSDVQAIQFSTDGTKLYASNGGSSGTMYQHTLSTAWNITTRSQSATFSHNSQLSNARGMYWKPDGTKFWLVGNNQNAFEYNINSSYPWNLSYASYTSGTNVNISSSHGTGAQGITFKPDGTKMFICDYTNHHVVEWGLSTAWDITTASSTATTSSGLIANTPKDIVFNSDGTVMYIVTASQIHEYNLSTAYDLSTISSPNRNVTIQATSNQGLYLRPNNIEMYSVASDVVYKYTLPTTNILALGSGSFSATDVGKRITGNGGDVILTSTAGAFSTTGGSAFTDSSTIASGSWQMFGLKSAGDALGITMPKSGTDSFTTFDVFGDSSAVSLHQLNNNFTDTGGNYTGTGNSAFNTSAKFGSHSYYTGTNSSDVLTIPYNQPFGAAWTASFWYKRADSGGNLSLNSRMVDFKEHSSTGTTITWEGDNKWYFHLQSDSGGVGGKLIGGSSINNNQWHHIVVGSYYDSAATVYKGKVYVDGVESTTTVSSYSRSASNTGGGIVFGGVYSYTNEQYFDQIRIFNKTLTQTEVDVLYTELANALVATGSYHVGVTNTSGRIDSSAFVDINSMTAAQVAGSGTVNYAVSTDGRTTWNVAKSTSGVRPIVRNNSGTWQYNNNSGTVNGYDVSSPTYLSNTGTVISSAGNDPTGITFKPDGTKMYVANNSGNRVNDFVLSTPWDVSTAASDTHGGILSTHSQDQIPMGVQLKSDGTKAYVLGVGNNALYQYTLTNAWDVFPSSYDSVSFSFASQDSTCTDIFFKPDGTQLFLSGSTNNKIFAYSLSTAWDLSTMSYSNVSLDISSYETGVRGVTFSADGTKVFTVGPAYVRYWTLSTAWDLSTASYTGTYNSSGQGTTHEAIAFKDDGTKMYIVIADAGSGNQKVNQYTTGGINYGTSATWANGTVNDELYTLQQALGAQAFNRMDKTQLDAVADANHFPTGSSLDLMIALRMDAAASTLPTSDGVTLNYDAAALNEGAILGTDYDFFHPAANKVQIKSLAAQNLKVRVV